MEHDMNPDNTNPSMHSEHSRSFRDTFRDGSPDDVRDKMKDMVAKGVAVVAGALRGFTDEVEREHVADQSRSAIRTAGDTVGKTASTVTEEVKNLKEPLKEAGQKIRETAREIGQTAREEVSQTRESLRGTGSTSAPTSGSTMSGGSTGYYGSSSLPDTQKRSLDESDPDA